jgi:hypothetical protein
MQFFATLSLKSVSVFQVLYSDWQINMAQTICGSILAQTICDSIFADFFVHA